MTLIEDLAGRYCLVLALNEGAPGHRTDLDDSPLVGCRGSRLASERLAGSDIKQQVS